jgi:hypothetical protein
MKHEHTENESDSPPPFERALELGRHDLATMDPRDVAHRSGATYEELSAAADSGDEPTSGIRAGRFKVNLWAKEYSIYCPQGTVSESETNEEPAAAIQIILLHYLINADGTPPVDEWIAFRQLPGGQAYEGAFRQRAPLPLAAAFDANPSEVTAAAEALGGTALSYGDVSYLFRALPRLRMAVVFYRSDDEFPASANVLFDGAAENCLPTEDLAVLGELLADLILQGAPR